jgi:ABC-type multidrug transport system ATPase subunit
MEMAIVTQGLTRRFDARTVVDRLDLAVQPEVITGFLGPNGAGKTTTISLLLGLLTAHGGSPGNPGRGAPGLPSTGSRSHAPERLDGHGP